MTRSCHHCGNTCRDLARFCDHCGTPLAAPAPAVHRTRTELRQGTLMFCDLVNSTRLANELDPDDLRLVFAAFQRVMREVIWRHGGYLIRFAGDGAFAVFGYPAAQEDSAESALRAGLGLVHAIRGETLPGLPQLQALQVRVGVATGPVVMGEMIGGAVVGEQSVTGPVAHLAARLAASAAPDTLLACDDTRTLVGQRFELQGLGALTLKGFPAPVTAWQVQAEATPMSRFDAQRGRAGMADLIGRDDVMHTLLAQWQRATQGEGSGALVQADAGMGKSRLARALLLRVSSSDMRPLELQCASRAQGSPLHPVGEMMRRLADIQPADDSSTCAAKARLLLSPLLPRDELDDALRDLLPLFCGTPAPGAEMDSPERVRQRMIDRLLALLQGMSRRRAVLMLVEDLHWADPTTLTLLNRLLEDAPQRRMMVLVTARAAELQLAAPLPNGSTLNLAALPDDDAATLVRQAAGGRLLSDVAVHSIVQRGEGNALFLEELALAAAAEGSDDAVDRLPGTLQHLVQARLDRHPDCKPVIQAAAVLGREFRWPLLARLCDGMAIDDAMGWLVEQGLLVPGGSTSVGTLRFKHALIQDAVYQTLLRGDRQRLHNRTAELLATDFAGSADAGADQRAHHLAQAGRSAEAVDAWLEASRDTAARAAYQESISHVRQGLALLPEVDDRARRRTLELRLKAQIGLPMTALMGYAVPDVERAYAEASELVDESTPALELFPIVRGLCSYYIVRGQMTRADELARQCLQIADKVGHADLRIDALSVAAYPAMYLGRLDDATRLAEQAVALYAAEQGQRFTWAVPQDPATAAWALLTTTAWLQGDLPRADAAGTALLSHLQRLGRPFDTAYGTVWLSASCQLQRRFTAALQHGQTGLGVAQQHGLGTWVPAAWMQLCIAGGALAPSAESIATLQQVHQAFLQAGAEVSATFYGWGLAQAQLRAGEAAAARSTLAAALARADAGQETYMRAELLVLRAAAQADPAQADADLQAALADAERQGALTVALRAAAQQVLRRGRDDVACTRAQEALSVIDGGDTAGLAADWVARQLALLRPAAATVMTTG